MSVVRSAARTRRHPIDKRVIDGVVLAGGRSRRMGRDKALLLLDGVPLYVRSARLLLEAGCSGVAVIGRDELPAQPEVDEQWSDLHGGEGPVDGLITALTSSRGEIVTVLAVDLPDVPSESLIRTRRLLAERSDVDVALLRDESGRIAIAGSWRSAAALPNARTFFANGGRSVLELIDGLSLATEVVDESALLNLNRPDDWKKRVGSPSRGFLAD